MFDMRFNSRVRQVRADAPTTYLAYELRTTNLALEVRIICVRISSAKPQAMRRDGFLLVSVRIEQADIAQRHTEDDPDDETSHGNPDGETRRSG
jgi:hypothetical protein